MDTNSSSAKKQIMATLAVLVVIAVISGGAVVAARDKDDVALNPVSPQATGTVSAASTSVSNSASYRDGTYTANGSYDTPGGRNSIDLSITIANGVVSSTSASTNAPDHESEMYDQMFINSYKSVVVGKSLNQVSVSRVAGASLTTQGFNNALEQIASQAKS